MNKTDVILTIVGRADLTETQMQALTLSHRYNMTTSEIAALLNISQERACYSLCRAYRRIVESMLDWSADHD